MALNIKDIVQRTGLALETEDRMLLGSHLVQGTYGGILRLRNERYYQSIIWRALSPKYKVLLEVENYTDMIVEEGGSKLAVEMKRWMSGTGIPELRLIRNDIEKLKSCDASHKAIMLFVADYRNNSKGCIKWIQEQIADLGTAERYEFSFDTFDENNNERSFWLGLWVLA